MRDKDLRREFHPDVCTDYSRERIKSASRALQCVSLVPQGLVKTDRVEDYAWHFFMHENVVHPKDSGLKDVEFETFLRNLGRVKYDWLQPSWRDGVKQAIEGLTLWLTACGYAAFEATQGEMF